MRLPGYAPGDVTTAVLSHLHQDHIAGLAELGQADIVAGLMAPQGAGWGPGNPARASRSRETRESSHAA